MAAPTTYNTETELSSVNSILGAIGQAPVQRLYKNVPTTKTYRYTQQDNTPGTLTVTEPQLEYINPEISFVHNLLMECDLDVQNSGWVFNREERYPLIPNATNTIIIPENMLRMDVSDGQIYRTTDVVRRDGKLYDKLHHTFEWTKTLEVDITWRFPYEDLPSVFKRYITFMASVRAATQLVSNPELVNMLSKQTESARAACIEYECNQGDYSYMGWPPETSYRSYQPYRALQR